MKRGGYLKRKSGLRSKGQTLTALCKDRIQGLLHEIVIARDGGCVLRFFPHIAGKCFNAVRTKDGHLVLQADHLNGRQYSVSYADSRDVVCGCSGHHLRWKPRNPVAYVTLVKQYILRTPDGPAWWAKVEEFLHDRAIHRMSLWDWQKAELALQQELRNLREKAA